MLSIDKTRQLQGAPHCPFVLIVVELAHLRIMLWLGNISCSLSLAMHPVFIQFST